jgi:hypothetical protein
MRRRSDRPISSAIGFLPFLLLLQLFSCEKRQTVTVPRPVFAVCPETPCRVPVSAVRGSVPAGERRPHDFLIDVRDYAARHPRQSPFRFAAGDRRRATPGRLEVWVQTGEKPRRVVLGADTHVTIDRLLFPQAPKAGTTAVYRPLRPAPGAFRCQDHADAGTWFAVPWTPASAPLPPLRSPSIQLHPNPTWMPLTVFIPQGRHFVLSRFPPGPRESWLALFACLGPVSLAKAEPGLVTTAQASGVSLWQWAMPEGAHWRPLVAALARDQDVAAAAVTGRDFHVELVEDPVDFLVKMLAAGRLTREEAWAAWTRMLLAGHPATEFARLRDALTGPPE